MEDERMNANDIGFYHEYEWSPESYDLELEAIKTVLLFYEKLKQCIEVFKRADMPLPPSVRRCLDNIR